MSDRRHCDREGCEESIPLRENDHPWKTITWVYYDGNRVDKHFCSAWCLAQFAVDAMSQREFESKSIVRKIAKVIE